MLVFHFNIFSRTHNERKSQLTYSSHYISEFLVNWPILPADCLDILVALARPIHRDNDTSIIAAIVMPVNQWKIACYFQCLKQISSSYICISSYLPKIPQITPIRLECCINLLTKNKRSIGPVICVWSLYRVATSLIILRTRKSGLVNLVYNIGQNVLGEVLGVCMASSFEYCRPHKYKLTSLFATILCIPSLIMWIHPSSSELPFFIFITYM